MLLIKVVTYASAMKRNHYSMVDPLYSFGIPRVLPSYNDYLNLKDDVFNLNFKIFLIIAHFKRLTLITVKPIFSNCQNSNKPQFTNKKISDDQLFTNKKPSK